ncbi:MAG TPA: hypothetical protein VEH05_05000 [Streptosporangiaceae bacterium]|nr:hypothetical protein [Streptosporangiaceae bacterium]
MAEQHDHALADTLGRSTAKRSRRWWARWPVLLILAWAALAVVDLAAFGVSGSSSRAAAPRTASRAAAPGSTAHRATTPGPARTSASPPAAPAVQVLVPVSASAFGPTGPASGDNPGDASLAIDSSAATAWQTDWYRSASFGNLEAGTGLLIDMGQPVTMTAVELTLGSTPGADLELLVGNVPDQSQMRQVAAASDTGGTVQLTLSSPTPARYLLIWFTLLPPDGAGTYQASVYDVRIEGTP